MIQVDDKALQDKIDRIYAIDQGNIFRFWEKLDEAQQYNLLNQVKQIDLDLLEHFVELAAHPEKYTHGKQKLDPGGVISLSERQQRDGEARRIGEEILRKGAVAAVLVAGGQGTRLGFDGPKGMYPVTPVKKKSLFQLHAEKLLALNKKYRVDIPWYIMTSQTNHDQTVRYFQDNKYLGYPPQNVFFFTQAMIPALDRQGKLILDAPDHIFMNPDGHGGVLKALGRSGAVADMRTRGIEHIFHFQVDNVLLRICDPYFLGYHVWEKADMSNKVVRKVSPEEKIGIICYMDGRLGVVEYSDLSKEDARALSSDGNLRYWAGSIAIHILRVDFVDKEGFKLPYHMAVKSIPFVDEQGRPVQPAEKNGFKFETFIFDALLDAENVVSLEVERQQEFSPLKNAEGENSPQTVRQSLVDLYAGWLEEAGYEIQRHKGTKAQSRRSSGGSAEDLPPGRDKGTKRLRNKEIKVIEISPLFALDAEELKQKKFQIDPQAEEIYLGP
jgi:UDP-N-acetylglucosamine/UDP-N-acetylgalactosamine diphosphorylase